MTESNGQNRTVFTCQSCGAISPKWAGKCEACGAWNTLVEETARTAAPGALAAPTGKQRAKALAFVDLASAERAAAAPR